MALSSMALSAGGALSGTAGAYYGASSKKTSYNAAADTAETNARIAELRAQSQLKGGEREEQKHRLATASLKGTQRAAFAANGVDLGEGSAAHVLAGTDVMGEIDALTIRQSALSAAGDTRMERVNYENDARTARNTARGINPSAAAFTSLLGSATEIAGKWYSFDKAGAFPWQKASQKSGSGPGQTSARDFGNAPSMAPATFQSPWAQPAPISRATPGIV